MLDYRHEKTLSWLSLITSSGTWLCCALPLLLTAIGLGSTVTALFGAMPWLKALKTEPEGLLILTALMLLATFALLLRPGRSCPIDPNKAKLCESTLRWNKRALFVSAVLWLNALILIFLL